MYETAKTSILSWWILALLALFLWYRNIQYDRLCALLAFTFALLQLLIYGAHSGANLQQVSRALYLTLWVQCALISIAAFIFIKTQYEIYGDTDELLLNLALGNMVIFCTIFIVALCLLYTQEPDFTVDVVDDGTLLWGTANSGTTSLLGSWWWLYALGLIIPFILLAWYYSWANIGIALIILYLILAMIYSDFYYHESIFGLYGYLSVGLIFIIWFVGMF